MGRVILTEGRLRQALCSNIGVYRTFILKIFNYPKNSDLVGPDIHSVHVLVPVRTYPQTDGVIP